jgi:pyruvate dehydrogenase E2 component (dihydrolipoamide acetyltransferase)
MTEILMPALSDSMEQGLVLRWLVADGAEVTVGEELCEIESDKATMTYDAEESGILRIIVPEGTSVPVGDVIARLAEGAAQPTADAGAATDTAPAGAPAGEARSAEVAQTAPVSAPHGNGHGLSEEEVALATPVARRLAEHHGIGLDRIEGTGPRGRITKADVIAAAERRRGPAPARMPLPVDGSSNRRTELTRLQQVIARRMAEAKSTIPHFQVQTEVAVDAALALRAELKAVSPDAAPSVNDLIVKAAALALRAHPHANGSYRDGAFELHERVNVGIGVAAEGALVVPTVFDADLKALGRIGAETRALAAKVRDGSITPPELAGATFTVSNLGMFGMTAITPVINPPQAAILGVGAARPTLVRDSTTGEIVDRSLLTLTLSCDHRILYGADAACFLAEIRALLETPLRLALG